MSLIYDYLKIQGISGSEKVPDVEIPAILKRVDTNRPNSRFPLLLLGSCLIGALFVFLIIKIFISGPEVQVTVVSEPVPQVQLYQTEPVPSPREPVVRPAAEPAAESAAAIEQVNLQKIIVVPKKHKPEIVDATVSRQIVERPAIEDEVLRRKPVVRLLELKSTKRKIVFPKNVPVYPEPGKVTEDITAELPGPNKKGSNADAEIHSSLEQGSAAEEKSGKYYQAGLQAQYKGDGRIAELYYNKALKDAPRHMDAMINLSALYVQQGRYAEAEKILAEILAIAPKNSKALVNMGVVSIYLDKESLAAEQLKAALAANPREENALVNLAYLAEKNGDYLATERYYIQLLQISPDNPEILLAYANLLEKQKRYREAIAFYSDTLVLDLVKKDRQLYNDISARIRLLAGVVKNSQP